MPVLLTFKRLSPFRTWRSGCRGGTADPVPHPITAAAPAGWVGGKTMKGGDPKSKGRELLQEFRQR